MTSYFDEHNCEPLGENETPNNQLLLARLLLDTGMADSMNMFESLATNLQPPTSQNWLKNELPKHSHAESTKSGHKCPICIKEYSSQIKEITAVTLPECKHSFHIECLTKWLEKTSNCPLCRSDLPTDDPLFEQHKERKKREKVREQDIADLHNSMYS